MKKMDFITKEMLESYRNYHKAALEELDRQFEENKEKIDITENISSGNVDHIISILKKFRESGYDQYYVRLYWDGYNSSIHIFK